MAYASWLSSFLDRNPDEAARMRTSAGAHPEPVDGGKSDSLAAPAPAQSTNGETEEQS